MEVIIKAEIEQKFNENGAEKMLGRKRKSERFQYLSNLLTERIESEKSIKSADLQILLNCDGTRISRIKNGQTIPADHEIRKLAARLNDHTLLWRFGLETPPEIKTLQIDALVESSTGNLIKTTLGSYNVPENWLIDKPDRYHIVKVVGDALIQIGVKNNSLLLCMQTMILNGEYNHSLETNDLVISDIGGNHSLKKLQKIDNDKKLLLSVAEEGVSVILKEPEDSIYSKVVKIIRDL